MIELELWFMQVKVLQKHQLQVIKGLLEIQFLKLNGVI